MGEHKQLAVNMVCSLASFAINIGIGLLLTPYVVANIGAEAYGFVGLANNMITYAQLLTIALNSVAGRFITVAYHRGEHARAHRYYSSTLAANGCMVAVLMVVGIPVVVFLDKLVNISPHLVGDVKALFAFIFLNFAITTISNVWTVAAFVKNKLYLTSLANMAYGLTRVVVMVLMFGLMPPKVFYVGLAVCLGNVLMTNINHVNSRRLLPEFKFRGKDVAWRSIVEMISSGAWNILTKAQQILMFGIQLLVANLMVSPYLMGMISIAQTIPTQISGMVYNISSLFFPKQTQYYAQGNKEKLLSELRSGMKISGFFANVIVVTLVAVGPVFLRLWQPGQDTKLLYWLLLLCLCSLYVSGVAVTLQNLPMIVNRLKWSSLAWLIYSIVSAVLLVVLVKVLPAWGVFLIASIPALSEVLANVTFVPLYAAHILGVRWYTFYTVYVRYFLSSAAAIGVCLLIARFVPSSMGWIPMLAMCCVYALATAGVDALLLLSRTERRLLIDLVKRKLLHR